MDEPVLSIRTTGRYGAGLYPLETNTHLEDVTRFDKFLDGSSANVTAAVARIGHSVAYVTGVDDDSFGWFIRPELTWLGVDVRCIVMSPVFNVPITLYEIFPPDDFLLFSYRQPAIPNLEISIDDLLDEVATVHVLWLAVSGLSAKPSQSANHEAPQCHHGNGTSVLDLSYRACFQSSEQEATVQTQRALEHVGVAIGNLEECRIMVGEIDPSATALTLLERGMEVAVVRQGMMETLVHAATEWVYVLATSVQVRNGLDADGGLDEVVYHGLLQGWDSTRMSVFASTAGVIVASRLECSIATPHIDEVERLMTANPQVAPVVNKIRC